MCYNMQVVKARPVGQAVKTLASHAGNMGSIPVRVTITCICRTPRHMQVFFFLKIDRRAARNELRACLFVNILKIPRKKEVTPVVLLQNIYNKQITGFREINCHPIHHSL